MSIDDVARELYGLVPEEFTAARNERAKEAKDAGDAELAAGVQSLRKPTAGAWLLNQLVRQHGDEVQQVLDLGAQLRAAQGTLGADELRALDRQRRQLTRAVAEQARDLGREAGRRVTDATTADVEETLRSAMVDDAAGAALSTGLLTDTFSSTGIEPVDLSRVVALRATRCPAGMRRHPRESAARRTPSGPTRPAGASSPRPRRLSRRRSRPCRPHATSASRRPTRSPQATRRREQLESEQAEARRRLARPRHPGRERRRARRKGMPRRRTTSGRSGTRRRRSRRRHGWREELDGPARRRAAVRQPQRAVISTMPRHISSVVPSPQAT